MIEIFTDYTYRTILLGSVLLGIVSGIVGTVGVLRQQGLLGDMLAHAALPGIVAAFMLSGQKSHGVLLAGAIGSGLLCLGLSSVLQRHTRLHSGTIFAVLLSAGFAVGVVLLTVIQRTGTGRQAGLEKFLLGQASAMVTDQVWLMAALGLICITAVILMFKEFKVATFDSGFAQSIGLPVGGIGFVAMALILVATMIGLTCVGVILMSAMLVAPAAAARFWTGSMGRMMVLAAGVGMIGSVAGVAASIAVDELPTGPAIVLAQTIAVAISYLLGPVGGRFRRRTRVIEAQA